MPPRRPPVPASRSSRASSPAPAPWTFLTNHTHVLICISNDPDVRLRDVAEMVGITERSAQAIVATLVAGGYLERQRVGRRNHYRVVPDLPLRHPLEADHTVGELLRLLQRAAPARGRPASRSSTRPAPTRATPARPAARPKLRNA